MTSEELKEKVAQLRKEIHENGIFRKGVSSTIDFDTPPSWYEPESFKRAQELFKTYQGL